MANSSSNDDSCAAPRLAFLGPILLATTLLAACAADGAGSPSAVDDADAGGVSDAGPSVDAVDASAPRATDSVAGDALLPGGPDAMDATSDAGPCQGCDTTAPPACEPGATALVAVAAKPTGVLSLAVRPEGALLAWVDGGAVHARLLDADAQPVGDAILIQEAGAPVSDVEVTPAAGGFAVFFSRGLLDDVATPDLVLLMQSRVSLDGSVTMPPALVTTGLQLARGSGANEVGFRLWGLRDEEDPDTGGLSRQASMARLSPEGAVDGIHYMLSAQKFSYMRLHHSGNQLNTPFVGPTDDKEVAYFLASIFLPGCGLPVLPVAALGPSASLAATGFISPQDALWAVRDAGEGRLIFHDMSALVTTERALPFPPTDLADMATDESGGLALLADAQGGSLVACVATAAALEVGPVQTVEPLPAGSSLLALRAASASGAWMLAWVTGPAGEIHARKVCAGP